MKKIRRGLTKLQLILIILGLTIITTTATILVLNRYTAPQTNSISTETTHYTTWYGLRRPIDTTIRKAGGTYQFQNTTNTFRSAFKSDPFSSEAIRFSYLGSTLQFHTPVEQNFGILTANTPVTKDNTITYPQVIDNLNLRYTIEPTRLLEEFIAYDATTAAKISQIKQQVTTTNISRYEIANDSIIFYQNRFNNERRVLTLPRPVIYELGNHENFTHGIKYDISDDGNGNYTITKVVTEEGLEWFTNPARQYPIAIDLVIDNADTAGNWVSSDPTNTTVSQETNIKNEGTGSVKITTVGYTTTNIELAEYASNGTAQAAYVTTGNPSVTGGTITTSGGYTIHTFNSSGTLAVNGTLPVESLIVGGGANGQWGSAGSSAGKGGGGGEVKSQSSTLTTNSYPITVGGLQQASSFNGISASGANANGVTSGNGNASGSCFIQYLSMNCGGGGGTGGIGGNASDTLGGGGGSGVVSNITGTSLVYGAGGGGAGGGGGNDFCTSGGSSAGGGNGGGCCGGYSSAGANAAANRGSGGGGGGACNVRSSAGGTGATGTVIIRYPSLPYLQAYSESSVKTEGTYALRGVATQTDSLNRTLTTTLGAPVDLTNGSFVTFDLRSNRTGSNLKIGLRDSGGNITEITPNLTSANQYQTISLDLTGVSNANKDAIDQIIITVVNADAANTFYLDNMVATIGLSYQDTVTRTVSPTDLSANTGITFWVRGTVAGAYGQFELGESASNEMSSSFTINNANTWEQKTFDLTGYTNTARDAITKYAIRFTGNTVGGTIYIDDIQTLTVPAVPTIQTASALSTTSIRWNFTDNSSNELGFKVFDPGASTTNVDLMDYSTDGNAQAAYVTSGGQQTATGGTITSSGLYKIHTFTSAGTFTPAQNMGVDVLLVGGGGGGSTSPYDGNYNLSGGGGGGGGIVYSASQAVTATGYSVVIGGGGSGAISAVTSITPPTAGGNTTFAGLTALGGGRGGYYTVYPAGNGGSGGGGGVYSQPGGTGTQGNNGGTGGSTSYRSAGGGGGGGAGVAGESGGTGGAGYLSSISGTNTIYAGGGGGGCWNCGAGAGGSGGGGNGGSSGGGGAAGTANTGGGGGGGSYSGGGGAGGSGVAIIRYYDRILQSYSDNSIKTEGSYSLKGVAAKTSSLNHTLTKTIGAPINLNSGSYVTFDLRASRTGSNLKIGIRDSGGVVTEVTPNITVADTFQTVTLDLSGVSSTNKDAIDRVIITVVNADAPNTFYIDNLKGSSSMPGPTCATPNISSCDETGLSVNTQYTRNVAAYNTEGQSAYSSNTSRYTLAEVPPIPTVTNRTTTTVQINPNPGGNPAATTYAIYRETNSNVCDGVGGAYLAANGSGNGSTAVWQTDTTWATVTATGLTTNTNYTFCVKARNGDGVETAFSDIGAYNASYVPLSGDFVCTRENSETISSNTFVNRYEDGNSAGRYVIAVDTGSDDGANSTNTATFEAKSCLMTINSNDTLVAGAVKLSGGSITIAQGGEIKIGQPLWVVDADADGYTADSKVYIGAKPVGGRRKNLVTNIGTNDCNEASNTTFQSGSYYVDTDGDGYGAGGVQSVCTSGTTPAGYSTNNSDCYNNNANAKPGSTVCATTHRGDGSFDYNCSGTNTTCGTTRYSGTTYSSYCRDEGTCGTNKFGDPKCCLCGSVTIIGAGVGCGVSGYTAGTYGTWQTQAGCVGPVSGTYAAGSGTQACQ